MLRRYVGFLIAFTVLGLCALLTIQGTRDVLFSILFLAPLAYMIAGCVYIPGIVVAQYVPLDIIIDDHMYHLSVPTDMKGNLVEDVFLFFDITRMSDETGVPFDAIVDVVLRCLNDKREDANHVVDNR